MGPVKLSAGQDSGLFGHPCVTGHGGLTRRFSQGISHCRDHAETGHHQMSPL